MTTHSIGEVKVNLGRILRDLNHGGGGDHHAPGRLCGRLNAVADGGVDDKSSLATLRGAFTQLPDADYQDFQSIRETFAETHGGHDHR